MAEIPYLQQAHLKPYDAMRWLFAPLGTYENKKTSFSDVVDVPDDWDDPTAKWSAKEPWKDLWATTISPTLLNEIDGPLDPAAAHTIQFPFKRGTPRQQKDDRNLIALGDSLKKFDLIGLVHPRYGERHMYATNCRIKEIVIRPGESMISSCTINMDAGFAIR